MYIDDFIRCVEEKVGSQAKRTEQGYIVRCPAHNDTNPSLSIKEAPDGKILLNCFAGCAVEEICQAIDLKISALFPEEKRVDSFENKKIDYIYNNEDGKPLYKKVRVHDKQFYIFSYSSSGIWEKGLKCEQRVIYRFPEVIEAKKNGSQIFLVEGEKDADRLCSQGLVATTPIEGAGSNLPREYIAQLEGGNIVLLYDEDEAGYKRRDQWLNFLEGKANSIKVVKLPGLEYQEKSGKDMSDWLQDGHSTEELLELVDKIKPFEREQKISSNDLKALNIEEFLATKIPERKMILDPIIPSQGLSLLYSKRGVGKTFLALAIGYAVASGTSFLRWKSRAPIKVLYVDGEMPANLMQERIEKLVCGFGVELTDPSYFRLITPDLQEKGIADISTEKGQNLIENAIGDAQLIILDNLSTLAPSVQENEADAWTPIQTWILKLRKSGISVLIVHHAGKSGRQRGTSRREDTLDSVIMLKHSDSYAFSKGASFEVHIEKARGFFGDDAKPFVASLEANDDGALIWKMEVLKDDLYDSAIDGIISGKSYRELATELKVSKSKIEGFVTKARKKGDLPGAKDTK